MFLDPVVVPVTTIPPHVTLVGDETAVLGGGGWEYKRKGCQKMWTENSFDSRTIGSVMRRAVRDGDACCLVRQACISSVFRRTRAMCFESSEQRRVCAISHSCLRDDGVRHLRGEKSVRRSGRDSRFAKAKGWWVWSRSRCDNGACTYHEVEGHDDVLLGLLDALRIMRFVKWRANATCGDFVDTKENAKTPAELPDFVESLFRTLSNIFSLKPFVALKGARWHTPGRERVSYSGAATRLGRPRTRNKMAGIARTASRRLLSLSRTDGFLKATTAKYAASAPPTFHYQPLFESDPANPKNIPWRKLTDTGVRVINVDGKQVLKIEPEAITLLAKQGMTDIAHLLRPGHLQQLRNILDDLEASENDRFVALELLKNANIAAGMVLPGCQDTGTAIVMGKKGQNVWTEGSDEEHLSKGVYDAYVERNLRYSQVAPITMYEEKNTGSNLPAQIDLYTNKHPLQYDFHFMAKGGGSANKTFLYQETKALLNPERIMSFLEEKIKTLGTSACPPYHLAFVVGGLSAEQNLKTVKMASARYYDDLPSTGNAHGRAFRDIELESEIKKLCQTMGIGAQFGGKYFVHDVRVIRLPRHGASCPVGLGVSCSADRQVNGKITPEGVFLEQLETDPSKYLPDVKDEHLDDSGVVVNIDLNKPMSEILETLNACSVSTRLRLTGPLVVARDIAHAKIKELLDAGEEMPTYMKNHAVYYAGPAKTPDGMASGSFGPTTAGRMDSYVETFQANGGSMVMLAKGNRSAQVTRACKSHGGFYLGSIGGPAAILAQNNIKKVEVLEYPELGMEAVWKIEVEDFPAFVIVDDKGNDFFKKWQS